MLKEKIIRAASLPDDSYLMKNGRINAVKYGKIEHNNRLINIYQSLANKK
jgi:hypothetical protein